jgi:dihydrodipicolinate synthase/N-acetylneuraminate lyase
VTALPADSVRDHTAAIDPMALLQPRRKTQGISAILLPLADSAGQVDWPAFDAHLLRTVAAGLTPAVNMDTGYVNLIDTALQDAVLDRTARLMGGQPFVAGAYLADHPGSAFDRDGYLQRCDAIQQRGGLPILFPSYGLTQASDDEIVRSHVQIAAHVDRFLAFELTPDLSPCGKIYSLAVFEELLAIPACVGAKHSSFHREPEWQRLLLKKQLRPDFRLYTGNDFAIDMIMYGSDYLLGLSTFAPDWFALRDRAWETGDPRFFELNDLLQYLGRFTFRRPAPAYKHSAAQFLKLRGWVDNDCPHPQGQRRPDSDVAVLQDCLEQIERFVQGWSRPVV